MLKTIFSTFVSRNDKSALQASIMLKSLLGLGKIPAKNILIHRPGGKADMLDQLAKQAGVAILNVEAYGGRLTSLDKLAQLKPLMQQQADQIVILSPSVAVTGPVAWPQVKTVAAKIVDSARPAFGTLENIFRAAGQPLGLPTNVSLATPNKPNEFAPTQRNNCNSRVMIFNKAFFNKLAPLWLHWGRWCGQNPGLLAGCDGQADQVAYALAATELRTETELLDLSWNCPAKAMQQRRADQSPKIVFFHDRFDNGGTLLPTGLTQLDNALSRINKVSWGQPAKQQTPKPVTPPAVTNTAAKPTGATKLPRLAYQPGLSSAILPYVTFGFEQASTIQIGLTDLASIKALNQKAYLGLDTDEEKVVAMRRQYPNLPFKALTAGAFDHLPDADLIVAIDQAFTADDPQTYIQRLSQLAKVAQKRLVIRGFEYSPENNSKYHGSIIEHLKGLKLFHTVLPLSRDGAETIIVADKMNKGEDYKQASKRGQLMTDALALNNRPALLSLLADIGRANFGFFTTDFARSVELPWVVDKINMIEPGKTQHLDIGSGLNPLPIFTAARGASVTTIDNSPLVAQSSNRANWPQAGYIDYSQLSNNCRSLHQDIRKFAPQQKFDLITLTAMLHLLPKNDRNQLLMKLRDWLKPGGQILLSLRLVPHSLWIWPVDGQKQIASKEQHGHLESFRKAIQAAGLEISHESHMKSLPYQSNDVWLAELSRPVN